MPGTDKETKMEKKKQAIHDLGTDSATDGKVRVQIDMTPEQNERMERIRKRMWFSTRVETVRRALELMDRVVDGIAPDAEEGAELVLRRPGKLDTVLVVL